MNASPEEKKAPETPSPSGPGDPPALERTEGPAQNEGADHSSAGRLERETAARTGEAGQEKELREVTGPRFWTLCPEVSAPRLGWALW